MDEEIRQDGITEPDSGEEQAKRPNKKIKKLIIIIGACVLAAAGIAAVALVIFGGNGDPETLLDTRTAAAGVSVGGVDISGMTRDEALAATATLEEQTLSAVNFTLDVNGETSGYTADFFCVTSDYEQVIDKALLYGHTGTFDERTEAYAMAAAEGKDFPLSLSVDGERLNRQLELLKTMLDVAAVDAQVKFTPWGHLEDGSDYTPEIKTMVKNFANGKSYTMPELVQLGDDEKPNPLRYLYWRNTKYIDGYIPYLAYTSRFVYTPETEGYSIDIDYIFDQAVKQVKEGGFSTIVVPCEPVQPAVTVESLKKNTQLLASWTSSYSDHYSYNRNWNVAMMSTYVNGAIIEPGQVWSVNQTAGPRDDTTARTIGWRKAAGLLNGGTTQQVGGGVCQLGSTTFNAAIRSGLTIAESNHHTIPSGYIPLGLDATLNTLPDLDLKLKNDNTSPYYLVSYVNPKDKNVTVEVYGPPLIDAQYGEVIYNYSYKNLGRYGSPKMKIIEVETGYETPDGKIINADRPTYVYAGTRRGTKVQTYRHILSLDGKEIIVVEFEYHEYPDMDGITYKLKEPAPSSSP